MDLKEYVIKLVDKFGVHQSYKRVINLIIIAESHGDVFKAEKFETPRDRAALAMPYQVKPEHLEERKRILNFLELLIIKHRQAFHGENWDDRRKELRENTEFTEVEKELLIDPRGFWGP